MSIVIVGMTMSLDGFVSDSDGSLQPLYPDFAEMHTQPIFLEEIERTGAVVMGRRTFDMAENTDAYADDYEFQVPIFVLTHHAPEKHPRENERLTITFVSSGIVDAIAQAKRAAGDRDVTVVGGPSTIRQVIETGLADELQVDVMPMLLGGGLRLFDSPAFADLNLELVRMEAAPSGRAHLRYRVNH